MTALGMFAIAALLALTIGPAVVIARRNAEIARTAFMHVHHLEQGTLTAVTTPDPQPLDDDGLPLTTIRIDLAAYTRVHGQRLINGSGMSFPGGQVVRGERDAEVALSPNVTVVAGAFALPPLGSRKHPELGPIDGIVVEVRDVPYERLVRALRDARRHGDDTLDSIQLVDAAWLDKGEIEREVFELSRRLDTLRALLTVRAITADKHDRA
jgi:hypothetical protein